MPTTDSQIKTMPSGYVVTGTVKDAFDTGLPVVGLQYFFINNESKPVGQIFHSPDGNYSIALPGATDNINFWAPGYEPIVLTAKELAMVNEVLLVKEKKDGIIFPAAALVAIILLYNHAKKKRS